MYNISVTHCYNILLPQASCVSMKGGMVAGWQEQFPRIANNLGHRWFVLEHIQLDQFCLFVYKGIHKECEKLNRVLRGGGIGRES